MVAVGDSAEIELIFSSGRRRPGSTTKKKATVTTNDNSLGSFQLAMAAAIYMEPDSSHLVELSAIAVTFDEENRHDEVKIKVTNRSDDKLKMRLVSHPAGVLEVDVSDKDINPGKDREIKVKIDKDFAEDNFRKSFTFELSDPDSTRYTIPVALKKAAPPQPDTLASGRASSIQVDGK